MQREAKTDPSASPQGVKPWWHRGAGIAATLAIGCTGGVIAWLTHVPLPWMLGPLLAAAAFGLLGGPVHPVREARTFGQVIVGASIGLQFTQALLLKILLLTPLIAVVSLFSILVGAINAVILMRLSGLDRTTAFFATTPGGVVEMMNQAGRYGAELEPIAVTQTMRVCLIVVFAPLLVIHFSVSGAAVPPVPSVPWLIFIGLVILGAIGGYAMAYWSLPNAWMMGPMIIAGIFGAMGLIEGRGPDLLLIAAQVAMGTSLGTMFRREFLTRLLPLMLTSILVVVLTAGTLAAVAIAIAYALALPPATMVLALAPAGMAEMVVTGKLLGLDATLITGFQLLRIILILVLCRPAYLLFRRVVG